MKVLSLFDGISCGMIALERAGIKVDEYHSFEIDKDAIKISQSNYPNIIQHGSVVGADFSKFKNFDLVIAGSPCQGFSFAGKQLAFDDPRSVLFFEFVRALKEIKPKYFLLENVVMKKESLDVISKYLNTEPLFINSSLVSAQLRPRMYWTNIPNVTIPSDKNIKLSDILEKDYNWNKATIVGRRIKNGKRCDSDKSIPIVQCMEVRSVTRDKSNCLTTVDKDTVLTPLGIGRHVDVYKRKLTYRNYTVNERCRLQTIPDGYCRVVSDTKARKILGNAWTVDVVVHIFKGLLNDY